MENSAPELTIYLDYTNKSHILAGEALKDVYQDFRMTVLREADWATWKPHLVRSPEITKGWAIKKDFLRKLEILLAKANIPYTYKNVTFQEHKNLTPMQKFKQENYELVRAGLSSDGLPTDEKSIQKMLDRMWKKEKSTSSKETNKPRTAYLLWCLDNKERLTKEVTGEYKTVSQLLGKEWKKVSQTEKDKYKKLAQDEKALYDKNRNISKAISQSVPGTQYHEALIADRNNSTLYQQSLLEEKSSDKESTSDDEDDDLDESFEEKDDRHKDKTYHPGGKVGRTNSYIPATPILQPVVQPQITVEPQEAVQISLVIQDPYNENIRM